MSDDKQLLHWAEERGQNRELKPVEIGATSLMSVIESAALALAAIVTVMLIQGATGRDVFTWGAIGTALGTGAVVLILGLFVNVTKNFAEMREGQHSYRQAETYQPSPEQPQPALPHPPIAVHPPGKKEPYLLTEPEMPGREPLRLTPGTIGEILQLVLEKNRGTWSRRTLTRLRLASGEKLSRSVYESLTPWLFKSGVLAQEPQGGFRILADDFDELREIFPGLPLSDTGQAGSGTGRAGGEPGDRAGDGSDETQPSGGEVVTLAERRRREWLECNCDVDRYTGRDGND